MKQTLDEEEVYPSHSELLNERRFKLKKNIIKGKFPSVEDYLDIHYNLLREDFISSVREGIKSIRNGEKTTNIDVYKHVKIYKMSRTSFYITHEQIEEVLCDDGDDCKKFMTGSLLIFTRNNFRSISFLATVEDRNEDKVFISPISHIRSDMYRSWVYTVGECCAYFTPYDYVLTALRSIPRNKFPMKRYIIGGDGGSERYPKYLIGAKARMKKYFQHKNFSSDLNKWQCEALYGALTHEFAVIQGPPGTGKTFVGLKIVEALIDNRRFWDDYGPILVISFKNYALDQFIEKVVRITDKVVRVGGQSKNALVKEYTLTNLQSTTKVSTREILENALVVAMTTTCAARIKDTLESLECPIVIVEEAAEVLEAHVVAALTAHCQHLILLGDHKQLQPNTADYNISQRYHLGVSLFERMINNDVNYYRLEVQHRMAPTISNLLRTTIYPFLRDHPSVAQRPSIEGIKSNLYFIDHENPEEEDGSSKFNLHEATFVTRLARYLVNNLHPPETITILTMYTAQCIVINKAIKRLLPNREIKVSTLDAFQGRESDIILLSLVRSDHIGFLGVENRICVALSRAKNALYIIGNMRLLARKSSVWSTVKHLLVKGGNFGEALTLRCQNHPETMTSIEEVEDFDQVRDGGCFRRCQRSLKCGHKCQLYCHITDHKSSKCGKPCTKYKTSEYLLGGFRTAFKNCNKLRSLLNSDGERSGQMRFNGKADGVPGIFVAYLLTAVCGVGEEVNGNIIWTKDDWAFKRRVVENDLFSVNDGFRESTEVTRREPSILRIPPSGQSNCLVYTTLCTECRLDLIIKDNIGQSTTEVIKNSSDTWQLSTINIEPDTLTEIEIYRRHTNGEQSGYWAILVMTPENKANKAADAEIPKVLILTIVISAAVIITSIAGVKMRQIKKDQSRRNRLEDMKTRAHLLRSE